MERIAKATIFLGILLASFALGYWGADFYRNSDLAEKKQKPVIKVKEASIRINASNPIVYEKEYTRSGKVFISDFEFKDNLIGKTLEQIRSEYTPQNGFKVSWENGTLIIRQKVDDWSPEEKAKYRIKEYQGMLAVYRGPDPENDSLVRVTAICYNTLPANIKEAIHRGKYEFASEAALNDALENLDEYQ